MEVFGCYSKSEGLDPCEEQCDFCSDLYKGAKFPIRGKIKNKRLSEKREKRDPNKGVHTIRFDKEIILVMNHLAELDNRTMNNLVNTMLKNQLGILNYDFGDMIHKALEKQNEIVK